jgi:hypothetical protein
MVAVIDTLANALDHGYTLVSDHGFYQHWTKIFKP